MCFFIACAHQNVIKTTEGQIIPVSQLSGSNYYPDLERQLSIVDYGQRRREERERNQGIKIEKEGEF